MREKLINNTLKTLLLLFILFSVIFSADTLTKKDSISGLKNPDTVNVSDKTGSGGVSSSKKSDSDGTDLSANGKMSFIKQYFHTFWVNCAEKLKGYAEEFKELRHYGIKFIILLISILVITATVIFYLQKKDKVRFMTTTRLSVMDKEVQKACRLIERKFIDENLTPDMICEELVTGEAFLQALFKKELGMSIEDFINQVRINRIRILMNQNRETDIDDLISETGFKDREEFLNAFRKIVGVSYESFKKNITIETENV